MQAMSNRKVMLTSIAILVLVFTSPVPVNANVVPDEWVVKIDTQLEQLDADTTTEIVVFVVQSLRGHGIQKEGSEINEINKLAEFIFNTLPLDTPNGQVVGIGKKGKDNGVLVLVAMEEREWRIEVGYGLEGDITDIEANRIAQEYLIPKFQEEEYGEGLYDTVVALSQEIPVPDQVQPSAIRGRYFYEKTNPAVSDELPLWVVILIFGIVAASILVLIVLRHLARRGKIKVKRTESKGWHEGGGGHLGGGGRPSSGPKGGGGRSGGGGAKGKW